MGLMPIFLIALPLSLSLSRKPGHQSAIPQEQSAGENRMPTSKSLLCVYICVYVFIPNFAALSIHASPHLRIFHKHLRR